MKKFSLLFLLVLFTLSLSAQNMFNYQAIVRDSEGSVVKNTKLEVNIVIVDSFENTLFEEEHYISTDQYGVINLEIGNGAVVSGHFAEINWGESLSVKTNIRSEEIGLIQLNAESKIASVPKANYAVVAESLLNDTTFQADWEESDPESFSYIKNKPFLPESFFSGNYNDLTNSPSLTDVATSGDYNDLTNTPSLAGVATSGDYNDLKNKPKNDGFQNLELIAKELSISEGNSVDLSNISTDDQKAYEVSYSNFESGINAENVQKAIDFLVSSGSTGDPLTGTDPNDPNGDGDTSDAIDGNLGQVKYNPDTESLWYYDGSAWIELAESTTGDPLTGNDPNDPNGDGDTSDALPGELGQVKYNPDTESLWYYDGSAWIELAESTTGDPLTGNDPNDPNGDGDTSDALPGELGQVKYNPDTESLWYYDGTVWTELAESTTGDPLTGDDPNDPNGDGDTSDALPGELGQVKYNPDTESLWYYDGTAWTELAESTTGDPLTGDDPNDPNGDGDTSDALPGELGQVKYNPDTESLWYYDGTVWTELAESTTGDPLTGNDPNDPNGDGDTSDALPGELGQVKYNPDTESLWYYDGTVWTELAESTTGDPLTGNDPNDPNGDGDTSDALPGELGQVKYNPDTESLWYYDGSAWTELAESTTGDPLTGNDPNDPNGDGDTSDALPGQLGQVKYNPDTESLWYYDGTVWTELAESTTGDPLTNNDPNDPNGDGDTSDSVKGNAGDIKFNSASNDLWYYDGASWNPINTDKQLLKEILAGDNDANGMQIKNLADPTNDQDAVTKYYATGQLITKVEKESGKGLSSNDYTDAEKVIVSDAEQRNNKNMAGGYPGLDSNKKIDEAQLPKMTVGNVFAVNSETEQLALTAAVGDVAVRSDENKSYMHNGGSAGDMTDWIELKTPTGEVFSVNGKKGDVNINIADIPGLQTEINNLADLSSVYSKSETNTLLDGKVDEPSGQNNKMLTTDGSGNLVWADKTAFTDSDDQTLTLTGNKIKIRDGNEIDLSPVLADNQTLSDVLNLGNDAGGKHIKNMLSPVDDQDAATKIYVDGQLNSKVDKVSGKGLSTNDYTDADKAILENAEVQSNKNIANGYPGLDANKKIDESQLPKITVGNVYAVSSESEQLALSASKGDVAVRSDENKSYMHNGGSAGNMTDWTEIKTPTGEVFSVNGKKGDVTINITDIPGLQGELDGKSNAGDSYSKAETDNLLDDKIDKPTGQNNKMLTTDSSGNLVWANQNTFTDTDDQNLSISGTSLSIDNGNTVDLSSVSSDDQQISKSGSTISLEDGGSITLNDDETTNEIQDLSLVGDALKITNNTSATTIDLSPYSDNTDDQVLSYSGATLSIENGNSVNLSSLDDIDDGTSNGNTVYWDGSEWVESSALQNNGTNLTATGDVAVNGGDITTTASTFNLANTNATTVNIAGASTTTSISASSGTTTVNNDLSVSGNFYNPSDMRLKKNIETLQDVLGKLEQIRGVSFEYKDQEKYTQGAKIGVIAQEINKVYPELVTTGDDGFLQVDYTQLTGILIQAVKEQQKQMEAMKAKLSGQQKQIDQIMKKLGLE